LAKAILDSRENTRQIFKRLNLGFISQKDESLVSLFQMRADMVPALIRGGADSMIFFGVFRVFLHGKNTVFFNSEAKKVLKALFRVRLISHVSFNGRLPGFRWVT